MERVLLQGGAMGIFLLLALVVPRNKDQRLLNPDMVINLLSGLMLFLVVAPLVRVLSEHANIGLIDMSWLSASWAQFLVAFLLLDFTRYWIHRCDHRIPLLWMFHRVHHSSERMDATSGLRMHAFDFLQLSAIPIVLFGVLLDTSGFAPWVVSAALGVGVFFDAFQHANIRIDLSRPWWRAWHLLLNNPHFHAWHHTRDGHIHDGNYGNTLIIWDRLFGSDVTQPHLPAQFGISKDQALVGTQEQKLSLSRIGRAVLGLQTLRSRAANEG
jgi:sterol desaturase/sphingolipid hydroxylase (fatty acid hydroxylase superfamily)